jgi:hypothetical protein
MTHVTSRAPRPSLAEHPGFMVMLLVAIERFHCTLGEVREDYWLNRAWRALAGDPALRGRVARVATGSVVICGEHFGAAPEPRAERAAWRMRVQQRLLVDTGHAAEELGMAIVFATAPVTVADGLMRSLLAQVVEADPRFEGMGRYAGDLEPVIVPVAQAAEAVAAA